MPFKALSSLPKVSPCIGKQHGSPRKVRFHYKNKHNNREKEKEHEENKGKDTEKTRKGGTRKDNDRHSVG